MTLRTDPRFRLLMFESRFIDPLAQRAELRALSSDTLDGIHWVDDWRVGDDAPIDDPTAVSSVFGRLLAELAQWIELGRRIGAFPAEIGARAALYDRMSELATILPGVPPTSPYAPGAEWTLGSFNTALAAAIEDTNDARLEFVRVASIASNEDRRRRAAEVQEAASLINGLISSDLPNPIVDSISWALSGQHSALDEGVASPSSWRSNTALWSLDTTPGLVQAAMSLAAGVIEQETGASLPEGFVAALMFDSVDISTLSRLIRHRAADESRLKAQAAWQSYRGGITVDANEAGDTDSSIGPSPTAMGHPEASP